MAVLRSQWQRLVKLGREDIWQPECLNDTSLRGRGCALLRVIAISYKVFCETRAASRAAALSFSSLLGLGPLIAIAMLVAGMVLGQNNPNQAVNTLTRIIDFIAPQVEQFETISRADYARARAAREATRQQPGHGPPAAEARSTSADGTRATAPSASVAAPPSATAPTAGEPAAPRHRSYPTMMRLLDGFVAGSHPGAVGTVGAITLIVIVILLFKTIEDAFNEIWGVRQGRSWLRRITYYWTVLTLGAVFFFAAVTLLGASSLVSVFIGQLPFGSALLHLARWLLPLLSSLLLILILTFFYRCIPNTRVYWAAAFAGALLVTLLLLLNNYLAFLYVRRIMISRSLYGSLGFIPILMFGLYVFWLYVLIGGQVSYAVQNASYRASQNAWRTLSIAARERLSLAVFLAIGRRFQAGQPPGTATELSLLFKLPAQILNESITRLVDMRLVTVIPDADTDPSTDVSYLPANALGHITLADFKRRFAFRGNSRVTTEIDRLDPIVHRYLQAQQEGPDSDFMRQPLDRLIAEYPATPPGQPV